MASPTGDWKGQTELHLAAERNDMIKLKELLDSNIYDINAADIRGQTALHVLCGNGLFDEFADFERGVQLFLNHGADINIQDKSRDTPLHTVFYAYDWFAPCIIRVFLTNAKQRVNLLLKNDVGYTVFYKFTIGFLKGLREAEDFEELVDDTESLISDFLDLKFCGAELMKELLNLKNAYGCSTFQNYIESIDCRLDTVQRMIEKGANVNSKSAIHVTALMDAVSERQADLAKVLLEGGADPNIRDIFGQSAIFRCQTSDCFELLSNYGADLLVRDKFGRSPINEMLLYSPEDLPRMGIELDPALSENRPLVDRFLNCGLSVNARDQYGASPLHYAAYHGNVKMASVLLDHGADPALKDGSGCMAADLAKIAGNLDLVPLLSPNEKVMDEGKYQDPFKQYTKLIINCKDIPSLKTYIQDCVKVFDSPADFLSKLVHSPRFGLVNEQMETKELNADVLKVMQRIASFISTFDPTFRCSVYPVGSATEGTKIGDPDEFDFMFRLDYFSEECVPDHTEETKGNGFVMLKLRNFTASHPLAKFLTSSQHIDSFDVREKFQDYVTSAINSPDTWDTESLYFDGLVEFPTDKPVLSIHIQRFGKVIKDIVISVDIVPAVSFPKWIPKEMEGVNIIPNDQYRYFLLFQPPEIRGDIKRQFLRISRSLDELQYLQSLPEALVEGYIGAKILVSFYFCPKVQFDDEMINVENIFDETSDEFFEQLDSTVCQDMKMDKDESEFLFHENMTSLQLVDKRESFYNETVEELICHATLFRNGTKVPFSSWILRMDESLQISKIFTPKEDQSFENFAITLDTERGLRLGVYNKYMSIKQDGDTWIRYGPMKPKLEQKTQEDIEAMANQIQQNSDLKSVTVLDWLSGQVGKQNEAATHSHKILDILEENEEELTEKNTNENLMEQDEETETLPKDLERHPIEWEGGDIIACYDEISSYMLKNCLFHIASRSTNMTSLEIAIDIFRKLRECAIVGRLDSFFMPFLEVFTYANIHIRQIPEEDLQKTVQTQSKRIIAFCDLCLKILGADDN